MARTELELKIEERMSDFEEKVLRRIATLEEKSLQVPAVLARIRTVESNVQFVDEHKAKKILDENLERCKHLGSRYQLLLTKLLVVEEMARSYPEVVGNALRALSLEDPWWECRRAYSIENWVNLLVDLKFDGNKLIDKEPPEVGRIGVQ